MHNILFLLLISAFFAACSQPAAEQVNGSEFSGAESLTLLKNDRLQEVSDLAASVANKDMFWVHNDSGNEPELFLVDKNLDIKLNVKFPNLANRDWEDISVGPGPDNKTYLYIGEIGDNFAQYQEKMVYRMEEPVAGKQAVITIDSVDVLKFQLPGKRKDTETLMIDPSTKDLYVVSKREKPVVVYKITYPYPFDSLITADSITTIGYTQMVAGDISADGKEILMKNYQNVFYWKLKKNETVDEALKRKPVILPYEEEPQGEAVAFARDSSGYFTISEMVKDKKTYLNFYKRKAK